MEVRDGYLALTKKRNLFQGGGKLARLSSNLREGRGVRQERQEGSGGRCNGSICELFSFIGSILLHRQSLVDPPFVATYSTR